SGVRGQEPQDERPRCRGQAACPLLLSHLEPQEHPAVQGTLAHLRSRRDGPLVAGRQGTGRRGVVASTATARCPTSAPVAASGRRCRGPCDLQPRGRATAGCRKKGTYFIPGEILARYIVRVDEKQ